MAAPSIRMAAINKMMDDIRYKSQILARSNKIASAISGNGIIGLALGIVVALAFALIPVIIFGGVF
ncbi:MAG: tetrahydromethanopterin S-methyltransferase subunit F [Methanocorpusculum sp.]|nr:tetrahydromethanopterin S-methyltransferase subunit F [Methanocorpusculum sp.]